MTEVEYIKVSNKSALWIAKSALSEVMDGVVYGVESATYTTAMTAVSDMLENMFKELDGAITESNEGGK